MHTAVSSRAKSSQGSFSSVKNPIVSKGHIKVPSVWPQAIDQQFPVPHTVGRV